MTNKTTKESLIEEVQCPKCGGSGIQGVGGNEEEGYHKIRCDGCYKSGVASDVTIKELEDLIDQAHTAGRKEREEEIIKEMRGQVNALDVANEDPEYVSGFTDAVTALTDIKNHLES